MNIADVVAFKNFVFRYRCTYIHIVEVDVCRVGGPWNPSLGVHYNTKELINLQTWIFGWPVWETSLHKRCE